MRYRYVIRGISKFGDTSLCTFASADSSEEMEPQAIEVYCGEPGEELFEKTYRVSEQINLNATT